MNPPYLIHFACFDCRRSFKRSVKFGARDYVKPCSSCSGRAIHLGRHFKAPKATDDKQWAKVQYLVESGFFFHHVFDDEGRQVPYPETLTEARKFVAKHRSRAWTERVPEMQQVLGTKNAG